MAIHPLAGKPAPSDLLLDVAKLEKAYDQGQPDLADPNQLVSFGTSGHRGTPLDNTFTKAHILAITQAICDYRKDQGVDGPLYLGKDTHAISGPAQTTALEVLAANGVETFVQRDEGYTPTPVISHAILTHNRGRVDHLADGIVITPSHNPPADGGIKYNPTNGGPAEANITAWIQDRANSLLKTKLAEVKRVSLAKVGQVPHIHAHDYVRPYVVDLVNVVDMDVIRAAKLRIGIDPLGGAAVGYWDVVAEVYKIQLDVVNRQVDPTFKFMTVDHDGKIRMDCSSPYAMASLVSLKDRFDIAFGNDPDADRHGIVTPTGLMNPNHFLAVAIRHLLQSRSRWPATAKVGKTCVSSSLIDRVVKSLNRTLYEVPVGFKWFAPGLFDGSVCFGGEESAGASFLRLDGNVWTTDKDGLILGLLAAEITARTGKDPGRHYQEMVEKLGASSYTRIDAPASPAQKAAFKKLTPAALTETELAGDTIRAKLTTAPGNDAPIGGLKVVTDHGWFAARPSGTENIYKLYAESFRGQAHLDLIIAQAQQILTRALT